MGFEPGGGNPTAGIMGKSSSISVHGNTTGEVYAQYYGDAVSATVTSDILDPSKEVYGSGDSLDQKIVTIRIYRGGCGVA